MIGRPELSGMQAQLKAVEVIRLLDGLTVAEAKWVLREADLILNNTHIVSVVNPVFTAACQALACASAQEA